MGSGVEHAYRVTLGEPCAVRWRAPRWYEYYIPVLGWGHDKLLARAYDMVPPFIEHVKDG